MRRNPDLFLLQDSVGELGGVMHKFQRLLEWEVHVDGVEMREWRRLREERESETVAGIVRVQQIAGEVKQLTSVFRCPEPVDAVILLEPRARFRIFEGGTVG